MQLAYDTDNGAPRRAAIGLIVLQADETIEADFRRLMPTDIRLYHSRIPSSPEVTTDTLSLMAAALPTAAGLLPTTVGLNAIGYGCTSGATILGEAAVARMIGETHPGIAVSNPLSALKAACRALSIRRLGLVSPYVAEVSDSLTAVLAADGIAVTMFGSFAQKEERLVARIAPESVLTAYAEVGGNEACDAVFASCTNLRATEVLELAELRLGKPVLASNQVLAWHMLRLAGVDDDVPNAGALGRAHLSGT